MNEQAQVAAMLEYADSWVFVGLDGLLYRATFSIPYLSSEPEWDVIQIRPEYWERAYPEWEW